MNAYLNSTWANGSARKVNKIIEKEKEFVGETFEYGIGQRDLMMIDPLKFLFI